MGDINTITDKARQVLRETQGPKKFKRVIDLDYSFDFGKYSGWRFTDVAKKDFKYIIWLLNKGIITITDEVKEEALHYIIYNVWQRYKKEEVKDKKQIIDYAFITYDDFIRVCKNVKSMF